MIPQVLDSLRQRLPARWVLQTRPDGGLDIITPEKRRGTMRIVANDRLTPNAINDLAGKKPGSTLVVARYLSPAQRERLQDAGLSYLDLTGNTRIVLDRPALFIEREGADQNPKAASTSARSLKGEQASRVVRALIDVKEPPGLRALAEIAGVDPGYSSRLLKLLASENLIERGANQNGHGRARSSEGAIRSVEWPALLRRWATDAPLEARASFQMYLAPRGLMPMLEKLKASKSVYAVTGSLVATKVAPVAPPRLATIYSVDPATFAEELALTETSAGANVILAWSKSDLPFARTQKRDGLNTVALSQAAADLLSGPGRSPAEGDALIKWMQANEEKWRV